MEVECSDRPIDYQNFFVTKSEAVVSASASASSFFSTSASTSLLVFLWLYFRLRSFKLRPSMLPSLTSETTSSSKFISIY